MEDDDPTMEKDPFAAGMEIDPQVSAVVGSGKGKLRPRRHLPAATGQLMENDDPKEHTAEVLTTSTVEVFAAGREVVLQDTTLVRSENEELAPRQHLSSTIVQTLAFDEAVALDMLNNKNFDGLRKYLKERISHFEQGRVSYKHSGLFLSVYEVEIMILLAEKNFQEVEKLAADINVLLTAGDEEVLPLDFLDRIQKIMDIMQKKKFGHSYKELRKAAIFDYMRLYFPEFYKPDPVVVEGKLGCFQKKFMDSISKKIRKSCLACGWVLPKDKGQTHFEAHLLQNHPDLKLKSCYGLSMFLLQKLSTIIDGVPVVSDYKSFLKKFKGQEALDSWSVSCGSGSAGGSVSVPSHQSLEESENKKRKLDDAQNCSGGGVPSVDLVPQGSQNTKNSPGDIIRMLSDANAAFILAMQQVNFGSAADGINEIASANNKSILNLLEMMLENRSTSIDLILDHVKAIQTNSFGYIPHFKLFPDECTQGILYLIALTYQLRRSCFMKDSPAPVEVPRKAFPEVLVFGEMMKHSLEINAIVKCQFALLGGSSDSTPEKSSAVHEICDEQNDLFNRILRLFYGNQRVPENGKVKSKLDDTELGVLRFVEEMQNINRRFARIDNLPNNLLVKIIELDGLVHELSKLCYLRGDSVGWFNP